MLTMPVTKKEKKRIEKYNLSVEQTISDATTQVRTTKGAASPRDAQQEWFKAEKGRFGVRDARAIALLTISNAALREDKSFEVKPEDVQMAAQECIHSHDPHVPDISDRSDNRCASR